MVHGVQLRGCSCRATDIPRMTLCEGSPSTHTCTIPSTMPRTVTAALTVEGRHIDNSITRLYQTNFSGCDPHTSKSAKRHSTRNKSSRSSSPFAPVFGAHPLPRPADQECRRPPRSRPTPVEGGPPHGPFRRHRLTAYCTIRSGAPPDRTVPARAPLFDLSGCA